MELKNYNSIRIQNLFMYSKQQAFEVYGIFMFMKIAWNSEQIKLRQELMTFASNLDQNPSDLNHQDIRNTWQKCAEQGILGLSTPQDYGGTGTDPLTAAYVLEGLGYSCKDNGLNFSMGAHIWGCLPSILRFASAAQKERVLPKLATGKWIGALAVSEPEAGSDVLGIQTTAEKEQDGYVLNGYKHYITNAPIADIFVILVKTNPKLGSFGLTAFLVEKDMAGFSVSNSVQKMGLSTAQMGSISLENCYVSSENRLGKEGAGFAIFNEALSWERSIILAPAIGTMQRILEISIAYAKKRKQFAKPIASNQLVSSKLVDMHLCLETARMWLYKCADLKRQEKLALVESAKAKLIISEAWVQICLDAQRIFAGKGYLVENEIERELRDALGSLYFSGTTEIQKQIIAQAMELV